SRHGGRRGTRGDRSRCSCATLSRLPVVPVASTDARWGSFPLSGPVCHFSSVPFRGPAGRAKILIVRIFLTGATGYIGSALCRRLAPEGHELRALVRPTSRTAELHELGVATFVGDLADRASM